MASIQKCKYVFGAKRFATKKCAQDHFRSMCSAGEVHTPEAYEELSDLLAGHPDAAAKRGCGVSGFAVAAAPAPYAHQRCFYVVRADGTMTDFSTIACLSRPTSRTVVLKALRACVWKEIYDAKRRAFDARGTVTCPLTSAELTWQECHADHAAPRTFEIIGEFFVMLHCKTYDEFLDSHVTCEENAVPCVDERMGEKFRTFHGRVARIRLISGVKNLSVASAHRMTKCVPGQVILDTACL